MKPRWQHFLLACALMAAPVAVSTAPEAPPPSKEFLNSYCVTCHNQRLKTGGLVLDTLDVTNVATDAATWEKAVVNPGAGRMPPSGPRRPQQAAIDQFTASLETALDRAAASHPNP